MPAKRQAFSHEDLNDLREAQRNLVRELGFLDGYVAELQATNVQCHALIEIEMRDGITSGELGEVLLIEKSTASRLVNGLKSKNWIRLKTDKNDSRRKLISLTAKGKNQVARAHERANKEATAAMKLLDGEQQQAVITGISLYEEALRKYRLNRTSS